MSNIALHRLHALGLAGTRFSSIAEAVQWHGAVQAQDYLGASWALAQRVPGITQEDVDAALADGSILRTHIMRPTWHFVHPADIRWMLQLTAPRVYAAVGSYLRNHEIDAPFMRRVNDILTHTLEGGRQLTRVELGEALIEAGIDTSDRLRLSFIVSCAELDGVLVSGGRRGKQFTYALLEERAPQVQPLSREEALAEFARRYFTSHGPAQLHDFVWWSGLTVGEARQAIDSVASELEREEVDGKTYWFSASTVPSSDQSHSAYLLPNYDEYTVAYKDRSDIGDNKYAERFDSRLYNVLAHTIVLNTQVMGTWQRTVKSKSAIVNLLPFEPLSPADCDAIAAAAERYGAFLGLPVTINTTYA